MLNPARAGGGTPRAGLLRRSVRAKLLFIALAPLCIGFPIILGLVWYWSNTSYQQLLNFKVSSDLVTAHEFFERVIGRIGANAEALAEAAVLHEALAAGDRQRIGQVLDAARARHGLDFVYVIGRDGVMQHESPVRASADPWRQWPLVDQALRGGARSGVDVLSREELEAVAPSLRQRAAIELVPTPRAVPVSHQVEERGMVVHAAAPIRGRDGKVLGVIEAGMLLNRNLDFVDTINEIVYREGSLPLGSKGTTTLFIDDTRIATNVRLFEDHRALGTRVSQQVRDYVLGEGGTWLDSAFVVNDFYVSGYEPVVDSFGQRVGMLYVGFLEAPFREAKQNALRLVLLVFAGIGVLGTLGSLKWAREINRPIAMMQSTIGRVEQGDNAARVGDTGSPDELGHLAREFDRLLELLDLKRKELQRWADELEIKVRERTQELQDANDRLIRMQRQLVTSEKLAAIGELTAGVAHEINNPIAVMQGNLDVMREVLGAHAEPVRKEMRLLDEQVNRIRIIVTKLLQFARPGEFAGYVEAVDPASVIADCLVLTEHHLNRRDIAVVRELCATREAGVNRNELQQVLINLIVNAVQAMPEGGTLTLTSQDWEDEHRRPGVAISVRDTGQGIGEDDMKRIFDPFFTTKKTQGTGLGLSISHSLMKRYGGRIGAESRSGEGAVFTVWLLVEPDFQAEAAQVNEALPTGETVN
ncbi:MAG: cache domain-containing protein [Rhodocyclales bacterium]|nr:cache domain-containing protein [Rhodocyclales bacterium]